MFRYSLIFIVIAVQGCSSNNEPSVLTNSGKIVGHYLTSFKGLKYAAYQGIPYAEPPIGERRFEPPEAIRPWSGKLRANRLQDTCLQYARKAFPSGSLVQGSEDCLYLNVYTGASAGNSSLPVLLYIHGGGFHYGGNSDGEEHYLIDHDVLVVTIQYRLGVLGFLSTEDEVVSGNMGLKDQSLALRWIRQNIAYFGGDPARITLFGESAGGTSVHYHYLSPMSAGLFNNGISISGTAFNCWAMAERSRDKALQLAATMNCSTSDVRSMIRCLKTRSARDLTEAQGMFKPWRNNPAVPFGPVIEKSSDDRTFISSSPIDIISSGKFYDAPWIAGDVSEEGLFPMAEYTNDVALKELNVHWDTLAPLLLDFNYTIPKENHTKLSRKIRKHYLGEKPIDKTTFMDVVYLVGDRWFTVDAENAVRAQALASKNPVWYYYYSYQATDSLSYELSDDTTKYGICHGDDISLFLKNIVVIPTKSPRDMAMQKDLIKLLTSFAYDGKPNINTEWNRVEPTKALNYLHIAGPGNCQMKTVDNLAEEEFWNSIDFDENKAGKPT